MINLTAQIIKKKMCEKKGVSQMAIIASVTDTGPLKLKVARKAP